MALWGRIRHSRLDSISYQCKRWYFHIPGASSTRCAAEGNNIRILEKPVSVFQQRPTELYQTLRFFAVPAQFKPKPEEKDPNGPRLNNQIMAEFVRLVSDEGHAIVSRHEALERARKLKLDLVEVQRKAEPPVCKIMDFHREKYKQQVKEKDRAKSKSEVTLRKGDSKEVRFSAKTEQKDLQMKADTVKRLMERGYRVKCMAMGTEDQDLGGLLARLAALIEDVAVIESGPRVEKKQAFVLVRHIKFGPPKKGPIKKASTLLNTTIPEVQNTASQSNPIQSPDQIKDWESTESGSETEDEIFEPISINGGIGEKNKSTWSAFEASDDFEQVFDLDDNVNRVTSNSAAKTSKLLENVGSTGQEPVSGSKRASTVVFPPLPDPSLELGERKSIESKQFSESSKFSSIKENDIDRDRAQDAAKVAKLGPTQLPNKARVPPILPNASPLKPPLMEESSPKQALSHSGTPSIPTPGYGIFSAPKTVSPGKQYDEERNPFVTSKNSDSSKIPVNLKPPILRDESTQNSGSDKAKQGGWGIFSK